MSDNALGQRLRELRSAQNLTLQEAGARCGVAISTLSKIENGQVSPVYGTLRKIALGLGIPFEQLIADQSPPDARPPQVLTRAGETADFLTGRYTYRMHAATRAAKAMLPIVMTIESTEPPATADWSSHAGEEFLLVIEGSVAVYLEGEAPIQLACGDSVYIDSRTPHGFVKTSTGTARMVSVSYDPVQAAAAILTRQQAEPV